MNFITRDIGLQPVAARRLLNLAQRQQHGQQRRWRIKIERLPDGAVHAGGYLRGSFESPADDARMRSAAGAARPTGNNFRGSASRAGDSDAQRIDQSAFNDFDHVRRNIVQRESRDKLGNMASGFQSITRALLTQRRLNHSTVTRLSLTIFFQRAASVLTNPSKSSGDLLGVNGITALSKRWRTSACAAA